MCSSDLPKTPKPQNPILLKNLNYYKCIKNFCYRIKFMIENMYFIVTYRALFSYYQSEKTTVSANIFLYTSSVDALPHVH